MKITACVFDVYGTLFDVGAAAQLAAGEPGQRHWASKWPAIAADWRQKQLQYSWLRAITEDYCSFWQITQDGLDWALERHGLAGDAALRQRLLALYWELPAYPEVPPMLANLKAAGLTTAVLSNGSPDMLGAAVRHAELGDLLDDVLSVASVGIFKPARRVYEMVGKRFGSAPGAVLFVSSNGWDAAGAASFGFHSIWVNRGGDPVDRLPGRPQEILNDLTGIPKLAGA